MFVNLRENLRRHGFEPVRRFAYGARGGTIPIGTSKTLDIYIGGRDFCITDLWLLQKAGGGTEGGDFLLKNETIDWEYSNRVSPIDTGSVTRPKMPYQTEPGQPSVFELPFIVNAGDHITCYGYARYAGVNYFDVILNGYILNTTGAPVPYRPKWYHFNGNTYDLAANTYNVQQDVTIAGPSDFVCFSIASNWDVTVGIDVRETLDNRTQGISYTKRVMENSRPLLRPYNDRYEATFPVPFKMPNGSVLLRTMSNFGTVAARRPELTVFGYYDLTEGERNV